MDEFGQAAAPLQVALTTVMRKRRSVRTYSSERIPESVLDACFDLAILAPISHNLECWEMVDVRDTNRLAALRRLCLDQPAAPHHILLLRSPGPTSGGAAER